MARWRLCNTISILTNFSDFLEMNYFKIPISLRKHLFKLPKAFKIGVQSLITGGSSEEQKHD